MSEEKHKKKLRWQAALAIGIICILLALYFGMKSSDTYHPHIDAKPQTAETSD